VPETVASGEWRIVVIASDVDGLEARSSFVVRCSSTLAAE
jgi:hypothetical protein